MKLISKNIVLKKYIPSGTPEPDNFKIKEIEIDIEKDNQIIVKNEWISVDPYMRARMTTRKNYIPFFQHEASFGQPHPLVQLSIFHILLPIHLN